MSNPKHGRYFFVFQKIKIFSKTILPVIFICFYVSDFSRLILLIYFFHFVIY